MTNYTLILNAINARRVLHIQHKGGKCPDCKTAANSMALFAPDYFERGLSIYSEMTGVTPEELADMMLITDEKNQQFLAVKHLDKIVRLFQYLGGAKAADSFEPQKFREITGNWKKGGNQRKGVIDSFIAIFVTRIANNYSIPRDEKGRITGGRNPIEPTTNELNEMITSRRDIKCALNYNQSISEKSWYDPARRDYEMSAGAGDFGVGTSPTQASQIRSTFIALKLAKGQRNEHTKHGDSPKLIIGNKVAMAVLKAVKNNPIHPNTMANLNG